MSLSLEAQMHPSDLIDHDDDDELTSQLAFLYIQATNNLYQYI